VDELTEKIIGAAIEVHRTLGPGFLESIYEEALCVEFQLCGLNFQRQVEADVNYKGRIIKGQRLDLWWNVRLSLKSNPSPGSPKWQCRKSSPT
jgi:GxxExxY protein